MPHHQPTTTGGAALHVIAVYHNADNRLLPYEPGQHLTQVMSCWRHLTATTAVEVADWAFHVFNADLDQLETNRARPGGETDFLIACVYRLLRLRSLSTGDVVAVTTGGHTSWLACAPVGWHPIDSPTHLGGSPLTARYLYNWLWSKP
jgi:hypothetical protein